MKFLKSRAGLAILIATVLGLVALYFGLILAGVAPGPSLVIVGAAALIVSLPLTLMFRGVSHAVSDSRVIRANTARGRDTANSVGRVSESVRGLQSQVTDVGRGVADAADRLREVQELLRQSLPKLTDVILSEATNQNINPYSPRLVEATSVDRTLSTDAGRAGAGFAVDPDLDRKLALLLDGVFDEPMPRIGTVADGELLRHIRDEGSIFRVLPGYSVARVPDDLAYLVVHDAALTHGVWAGATNAVGFEKFNQLVGAMKTARSNGTVVAFVDSGVLPGALSHSIRNRASVIISRHNAEAAASTRFLDRLQSFIVEGDA